MRRGLPVLLFFLAAGGGAWAQSPPSQPDAAPREPVRDDWRERQREEELMRPPGGDWRDDAWTSEAWRAKSPQDRGYERQGRSWRAPRSFDAGRYVPPRGVRMHSWTFGQTLPPALRAPAYRIGEPAAYGLAPAPSGQDWVRVASDALLVDSASGHVAQAAYGLFR